MRKHSCLFALALATLAVPALAVHQVAPAADVEAVLAETFHDVRVFEADLGQIEQSVRETGHLELVLGGDRYDLRLTPNNLRSEGFARYLMIDGERVKVDVTPVSTYKGQIAGDAASVVRLSVRPDHLSGAIRSGDETLWIDPLTEFAKGANPNQFVVYRTGDVLAHGGTCGATAAHQIGGDAHGRIAGIPTEAGGARRWELVTEADGQYFDLFGDPGLFDRIEDTVNVVDGIYVSDNNLTVSIAFQQAWTDFATDPYTSLDAGVTLDEFLDWWNFNPDGLTRNHPRRDMVHMWSGKDFNGGVVGIAYLDAVCRFNGTSSNFSFGISQEFGTTNQRTQLTAHEFGHNWGSNHVDAGCNGSGKIMCSSIQSNPDLSFSSSAQSQIDSQVNAFGDDCLD